MPALIERRDSQGGKRDVLSYPASVFARKEAEAPNKAMVRARVAIRQEPALPGGGEPPPVLPY